MDIRSAPLLPPALAFVSGTALSFHLSHLPIPLLVSLLAVTLLPGRRAGSAPVAALCRGLRLLVFPFAVGLLWSAVWEDLPRPEGTDPDWHPRRPVSALVETGRPWRRSRHGWTARVEIRRLRQAGRPGQPPRIGLRRIPAYLSLPGEDPPPPPGCRLRVRGYLGRSAGLENGGDSSVARPAPWRLSTPSRRFVEVARDPGFVHRTCHRLRRRLELVLSSVGDSPGAALARALVLGDPSRLDPTLVRGLRRSGLGHLLALSGLHLGLMAGLAWGLGASIRLPRGARWTLILAAVGLYLSVAGVRPSLVRSAVLVGAGVAAVALERPPSPANALALAMVLLVAHRPGSVGDLGLQLTLAATFGLLVLAPWWLGERQVDDEPGDRETRPRSRVWRVLGAVRVPLAVSVAAQVATLPWALPAFHGVSPLAPALNLVAIPWTALALAVSALWLAIGVCVPHAAVSVLPLLDALSRPLAWPARAPASSLWFLPLDLSAPAAVALALGTAALLAVPARWREARLRRRWSVLSLALVGVAAVLAGRAQGVAPERPRLVVLDVGQGDAVLIQDRERAVLVDGGGFSGGRDVGGGIGSRVLLPALLRLGVRRLDAMILTHPDRDHCGGLVELGSWLPVEEVWTVPGWEAEPCVAALHATPGIRVRSLAAGGRGRIGRWRWLALHPTLPTGDARAAPVRARNGGSLVLAVTATGGARIEGTGLAVGGRGLRVLLTGDLDAPAEAVLLGRLRGPARRLLRADVLKVAHHGSRGSSSLPFLRAVFGPRTRDAPSTETRRPLALISCGRSNPYGHPARATLDRLGRWRATVLRTDLHGEVALGVEPGSPAACRTEPAPAARATPARYAADHDGCGSRASGDRRPGRHRHRQERDGADAGRGAGGAGYAR